MQDYEKLGVFYLGRRFDPADGAVTDEPVLYDSKDLTTHGVCVGMTGSGKTGLGVVLLEEAAIDRIPALVIDPKGDMGNLLLTFPDLAAQDFQPWIDDAEAARKGRTAAEQARWTADLWRKGLEDWGQDPSRIARFADAVERVIYTPGSGAGRQVRILRSLDAPPRAVAADDDAIRERIMGAVSGLLTLLGIPVDPIRSREHILMSTLLDRAWREGRSLDLPTLIREIQNPPIQRVGVFDLSSFFPDGERFELAMTLNNLLASPGFSAWGEGDPLDVGRLLYAADGRPRLSIFSIAHLSDPERMFFVTFLLNEVLSWMRTQPGSRTLRALLYMDEIFGYFPPSANPPSKAPMLTLLKQARAYGLGVLLATQNPVDLDYKGLSNAGTWFLGRLQTERDKMRVIEGLEGASSAAGASFDRAAMERTLAGLGSRVFLMNNVHEDRPLLFHTRWALSYLGGPLTRDQIKRLTVAETDAGGVADQSEPAVSAGAGHGAAAAGVSPRAGAGAPGPAAGSSERPAVPPEIHERFLPLGNIGNAEAGVVYRPMLLGVSALHYANARAKVDEWRNVALLAPLEDETMASPWEAAAVLEGGGPVLEREPQAGIAFAPLPDGATDPTRYGRWEKMLKTHLYREHRLSLWQCRKPPVLSIPGESEAEFKAKLRDAVRETRDLEMEKLRGRYAPKLQSLQDRIRRAEERLEREQAQLKQQTVGTAVSVGATILGALLGRKLGSVGNIGRATTAARGAGRITREKGDVRRADENVEELRQRLEELEAEFQEELRALRGEIVVDAFECDEQWIAPRKTDLTVDQLALVWKPEAVPSGR